MWWRRWGRLGAGVHVCQGASYVPEPLLSHFIWKVKSAICTRGCIRNARPVKSEVADAGWCLRSLPVINNGCFLYFYGGNPQETVGLWNAFWITVKSSVAGRGSRLSKPGFPPSAPPASCAMVQHLETGRLSSSGQASQCADSAGSRRPARRGFVSIGGAG